MAVQTATRNAKRKDLIPAGLKTYKMAGGAVYGKIWKGAGVLTQHSNTPTKEGYALGTADGATNPCRNVATNLDTFLGIATESVDNSTGADGDKLVQLFKFGEFTFVATGASITWIGQTAYLLDTQTVDIAAGTGRTICGEFTEIISATEVRVRIATK